MNILSEDEITLSEQTPLSCAVFISRNPENIEHCMYRNISDWARCLYYDYKLARFYDPYSHHDITHEEFFSIYLAMTSNDIAKEVNLLKYLPKLLWEHETYMRKLIVRNPISIFSITDVSAIEVLLLDYPGSFVDLDLENWMYNRILPELLRKSGLYIRFYVRDFYSPDVSAEESQRLFLEAVNNDGMALEHIPNPDDLIIDTALSRDKRAIGFCLPEQLTLARLKYCLDPISSAVVKSIAGMLYDRSIIKDIITRDGSMIRYFKRFQDLEIQLISVNGNPENLQYITQTDANRIVRETAVRLDGRALRFCGNFKTYELCVLAYSNAGNDCIHDIPKEWRDSIMS